MTNSSCVFIIDDNEGVRYGLGLVFESAGLAFQAFSSAEHFLEQYSPGKPACLILDMNMPGMTGSDLQFELKKRNIKLPIIFLTAFGDVPLAVRSIKEGAVDFLVKPVPRELLIERVQAVLRQEQKHREYEEEERIFRARLNQLTSREMEILALAVTGLPNKVIAQQLGTSYRTIENHRRKILKKTGAANYLELTRLWELCKVSNR